MISFLERRKLETSQKIRYFQQAASSLSDLTKLYRSEIIMATLGEMGTK